MFRPSDKQAELARFGARDSLHILAQGAMGSGKTAAALRAWLSWMATDCPPSRHVLCFKDQRQGKFELGQMAAEWATETGLNIHLGAEAWHVESMLSDEMHLIVPMAFGQPGATTAAAKFRNWNLASIFIDEAPEMGEAARKTLISRLRAIDCPRAIWTYNPDDLNGFKAAVFDPVERGDVPGEIHRMRFSDNPSLPAGYRAMMEANYPFEHERRRYIEGEWAQAIGAVYPMRHELADLHEHGRVSPTPSGTPAWYAAGVDWGGRTVTYGVLLARYPDHLHAVAEWRHDARRDGEMPTDVQAQRMYDHFTDGRSVRMWTIDRTAGDLIAALTRIAAGDVAASEGDILPTCRHVARFFNADWLRIDPACAHLRASIERYRWPEDHQTQGDKKPLKDGSEHEADGLRYGLCRIQPLRSAA